MFSKGYIIFIKLSASLYYFFQFIVGNVFGILILSLLLYTYSGLIGLGEPLSFSELILWVDRLPENSKTTLFTSLITISGFLIAFSIGSTTQKQQVISQLRVEASGDLEFFFDKASRNMTSMYIYGERQLELANLIKSDSEKENVDFFLSQMITETQKIIPIRNELLEQSIEVFRFKSKYSIIFSLTWGMMSKMTLAEEKFENITKNLWFNIPTLSLDTPDVQNEFIRQIDIEKCNNYIDSYNKNWDCLNQVTGGLRGSMLASVTEGNLSFFINILKLPNKLD